MDPALAELVRSGSPREEIEAIVRLDDPRVDPAGVRIVARFGRVATCRVATSSVVAVRRAEEVTSLKAARLLGPERPRAAESRRATRPSRSDRRRPPHLPLTGAGVVVGVVDWGCDVDHPNFKHPDGSTRLLALWDQRGMAAGVGPEPYGYGTVHSQHAIDRALTSGAPYEALGYHPAVADRDGCGSHGTHVLDIAAGNGRCGPAGIAPGADLVFVHLADRGTGGLATLGDSVRLLEAVDFIRRTAGKRPWVINISVGRHGGPHDGTSLVEQALDELLAEAPGRAVCMSAGNYFGARAHASRRGGPADRHELDFVVEPTDITPNELEAWYGGGDEYTVSVTPPARAALGPVPLGGDAAIVDDGRLVGRIYHRRCDPNNGDHHVDLFLYPAAPAGRWSVSFEPVAVTDGVVHAWLERDELGQARFVTGGADPRSTTGTIANAHLPLVVGAYVAHSPSRRLAPFSSSGPTRDGRAKPDVLAPGSDVLAARSAPARCDRGDGLLARKSGTSMAAPHVTGAAALCLQADPHMSATTLGELVRATASPPVVDDASQLRVGCGYLDVERLVLTLMTHFATAKETTMNTFDAAPAVGADRLYREIMYRPAGPVAERIRAAYTVVARAGEPPGGTPRVGDLLVRVVLGEPGVGHVGVLADAESLAGVLDRSGQLRRGQLLLRPATTLELDDEQAINDVGRDLVARYASGVRVAVYSTDDAEFKRRAAEWARREDAVGSTGRTITAATLAVGQPMSDRLGLVRTVTDLGTALATATGTTTGPARIRVLAIFSHGWGTTMAIGNGLTAGNVADVTARMAPALADDVTIVLYGCSVCRQPDETGGWVETTMRGGGARSLCGMLRDALVDQGKTSATVWGHTEVGHTTTNWTLRRFRAAAGKGTAGEAFAGEIVFGATKSAAVTQVEEAIKAQGHQVVAARRADFESFVLGRLERQLYKAYGEANQKTTHGGANLAERAPVYPDDVADVIRAYWRDTYWTSRRVTAFAGELITRLRSMKIIERTTTGRAAESIDDSEQSAPTRVSVAKDAIRTAVRGWGTDEAAILHALRALDRPEIAELSSDGAIIELLRGDLAGADLAAVATELARGRVGAFDRAELARVIANAAGNRLGVVAAAHTRDGLLAHQQAFDRTGTGTIHGSTCPAPRPSTATSLDCTTYAMNVLDAAFTAKGRGSVWTAVMRQARSSSGRDLKGTEILRALQSVDRWEGLFWSPDPRNPQDGTSEHSFAYKIVREQGTYYGVTVDVSKSVINYRRTSPRAAVQTDGLERLRRLPFGAFAARGGDHMAVIVNGVVYEVHRDLGATDRNVIEATPLESFAWQSGAIVAPPGDRALAWTTP